MRRPETKPGLKRHFHRDPIGTEDRKRVKHQLGKRWPMRIRVIREEADRLVHEHGAVAALEAVHREMKQANRAKNSRLESYKTQVAMEVSRRSGSLTVKDE